MNTFPARTGLQWIKQGMMLFRKQPGALMALFFCCMFSALFIMLVPLLGQVAPFVLMPIFTVAMLEGCDQIAKGNRALPNLLLSGFRKPARSPLLLLGTLNFLLMLVAMLVLYKMGAGEVMAKISAEQGKIEPEQLEGLKWPVFLASTIYTVGWLLSCLAAPLVYWQKMKAGKALFFSVVAVGRGFKAFLIATVALHLMYFIGCNILVLIFGASQLSVAGIFALFLLTIVLGHCTLYVAYRQIFDTPQVPVIDELS